MIKSNSSQDKAFEKIDLNLPGCFVINHRPYVDERGFFIKTFHSEAYKSLEIKMPFEEEYFTYSKKRVLRGMHFQLPPQDLNKVVSCVQGEILDVIVDLRVGSPTYGKHHLMVLSGDEGKMLYIPSGFAHGFYVLSEDSTVLYKVDKLYHPELDTGILWSSFDIPWPDPEPVLSQRDKQFKAFSEFKSPFVFRGD